MTTSIWPQPLIAVRDVQASSRFYAQILGAESAHGGDEYEQLVSGGELILQLHRIDVEDHHGPLAASDVPLGNGALLWFEVSDFDGAVQRARDIDARVERDVHVNPNAKQRELWLRDPDGYVVVVAGPSEYRPRPALRKESVSAGAIDPTGGRKDALDAFLETKLQEGFEIETHTDTHAIVAERDQRNSFLKQLRGRDAANRYVVSVDEHGEVTMIPAEPRRS
ncbi:hypothetical protein BH20ACT13_BH20ACT13_01400 [soil metagenome]